MTDSQLKERVTRIRDLMAIALSTSGLAIAATYLGLFQNLELSVLDHWFRLRRQESPESRVVVVTISEADLRQLKQWPISDANLSQLITKINQQQPRAIGLDLYRDLPIEPGVEQLAKVFKSTPNLIGVEKAIDQQVNPSPILAEKGQIALSDLLIDADGTVRRGLLSIRHHGEIKLSLATRLALMYLAAEGIELKSVQGSSQRTLGRATFDSFERNGGGYVNADNGGFQILLNFRGKESSFQHVSITDVLNERVPEDLMRDRLVLIGSIAPSLNDLFSTPYSEADSQYLPGVFIHANLASQIISEAIDGRTSIKTVSEPVEWLWVLIWTSAGTVLAWTTLNHSVRLKRNVLSLIRFTAIPLVLPEALLTGTCLLLFLSGWWLPTITSAMALVFSTIIVGGYYNQSQKKLAYVDGLTQIPNRRFFDRFLAEKWSENQKKSQPISLILCDIDYFKKYNDTYGHQAGDLCLQQVAQGIDRAARMNDLAARYGGEEFVLVLPNTDAKIAMSVAQRMCHIIRSLKIEHSSSEVGNYLSLSCGVASTSKVTAASPQELIAIADSALYEAKKQGRDRAVMA